MISPIIWFFLFIVPGLSGIPDNDSFETDLMPSFLNANYFTFTSGPVLLGFRRRFSLRSTRFPLPLLPDRVSIPPNPTVAFVESIPIEDRLVVLETFSKSVTRSNLLGSLSYFRNNKDNLAKYALYTYSSLFMPVGMVRKLVDIGNKADESELKRLLAESLNPVTILDWYNVILHNSQFEASESYQWGAAVLDDHILSMRMITWTKYILQRRIDSLLHTGYETFRY